MADDRLAQGRSYAARLRAQGRSDDDIREGLAAAGWGEADVATLMQEAAPPSPPPAQPARPQREEVKRPGELTFLIVLVDVISILGLLSSMMVVILGIGATFRVADRGAPSAAMGPLVLGVGVVLAMIWLGVLVVGHFLWNGANWARIIMMVLMALTVLQSLYGLLTGARGAAAVGGGGAVNAIVAVLTMLIAALFIVVLNKGNVKEYCSK